MRRSAGQRLQRRYAGHNRSVFNGPCHALICLLVLLAANGRNSVALAHDAQSSRSGTAASVLIHGSVLDIRAGSRSETSVPDAVVTLCQSQRDALVGLQCDSLGTTVSDANGAFELSLDVPVSIDSTYVLRAQAPEGQKTELVLKGNPAQWPSSVKLILEKRRADSEELTGTANGLRQRLANLTRQTSDAEAQSVRLRWQLTDEIRRETALEAKLAFNPGDHDSLSSQIEELQKKQSQTRDQIAALNRHQSDLKDQQEKVNIDLGKIFEQQERGRRQSGQHRVLFATDRASTASGPVKLLNLPSADGAVTLGVCESSIDVLPEDGATGQKLKPTPDADRDYAVQSIEKLSADKFWTQADSSLGNPSSHDALLYIHGYRSSFNDACRRAAQVAADLKFSGPVFLWSWPSRDELSGYFADEKMAAWSSAHFTLFLKQVLAQKNIHYLHIVAHSMGNRVLEQAIISPQLNAAEQARLGQIVFAAPDLSRAAFDTECNPSRISALRITLYASKHDQALRAAKVAHPFPRLGDANPDIDIRAGMDSIDASAVDTSLLGHSYIGNSRSVLADVAALISSNAAPDRRQGLTRMGNSPQQWWSLNP